MDPYDGGEYDILDEKVALETDKMEEEHDSEEDEIEAMLEEHFKKKELEESNKMDATLDEDVKEIKMNESTDDTEYIEEVDTSSNEDVKEEENDVSNEDSTIEEEVIEEESEETLPPTDEDSTVPPGWVLKGGGFGLGLHSPEGRKYNSRRHALVEMINSCQHSAEEIAAMRAGLRLVLQTINQ